VKMTRSHQASGISRIGSEREHPVEHLLAGWAGAAFTATGLVLAVWQREWAIVTALALALAVPFSLGFGAAFWEGLRDGLRRRRR